MTAVRRHVTVDGDRLGYALDMAAVGVPLCTHLQAVLHRVRGTVGLTGT